MKKFSLNNEEINGYIVTKEIKKLWKIELDMLKQFDQVCTKYNLKYFADSGTLLGAVRHKGFIPWDDDIDIVMLRKDYDKLLKYGPKEFKKPYFLQSAYTDKEYYRGHAQLRNIFTTAILENEGSNVEFNQGIFLDIFPLDEVSKFSFLRKIKFLHLKFYRKIFYMRAYNNIPKGKIKRTIKKIIKFFLLKIDAKKIYKKYEKKCRNNIFKSGLVSKVSYYESYNKYKLFSTKDFSTSERVPFENMTIPIPKNWDYILKKYYGDNYMKPVCAKTTHGNLIIDTEQSYCKILKKKKNNYFYFQLIITK